MNKFNTKSSLIISLVMFLSVFSAIASKKPNPRIINIAGLVVNAQTLSPIQSAKIYDSAAHLLGETDKKGYFNVAMKYIKTGAINFKLKIEKQGYHAFLQHENWGDLATNTKNIMYFGLEENTNASSKAFSSLANASLNGSDLSYQNVVGNFSKVREQREFEGKLETAKAGNQNVLVSINKDFYIVDKNGWIKINSGDDLISVNKKQLVKADQLTAIVKRKDVKGMTPLDAKEVKFEIYTR